MSTEGEASRTVCPSHKSGSAAGKSDEQFSAKEKAIYSSEDWKMKTMLLCLYTSSKIVPGTIWPPQRLSKIIRANFAPPPRF